MRLCFLIRHSESQKNVRAAFSSDLPQDELTPAGLRSSTQLSDILGHIAELDRTRKWVLFYAPSNRAELTASVIANRLGLKAKVADKFQSINAGIIAGVPEAEAEKIAPNYMRDLSLYRLGLMSSYRLRVPEGGENLAAFEQRILRGLTEIFDQEPEDNIAIVAHRSPITAILIHYARQCYGYPREFFGYVPLEAGAFSVIQLSEAGAEIIGINCRDSTVLQPEHSRFLRVQPIRTETTSLQLPGGQLNLHVEEGADGHAQRIKTELHAFNQAAYPSPRLSFTVTALDFDGRLAGGAVAYVHWGVLCVEALWVDQDLRKRGIGAAILQRAELEGSHRGAQHAWLETFSWQARPFYEKHGYTVFGEVPYLEGRESRIFMKKTLPAR